VVVLEGYKTVKEALLNRAEEFGDRDMLQITHDYNQGHGNKCFATYLSFSFPHPLPLMI